jgi:hypothetical protein
MDIQGIDQVMIIPTDFEADPDGGKYSRQKRAILLYANSAPTSYRAKCAKVAAKGYKGFALQ